jgi:phosphate transport system permease protein
MAETAALIFTSGYVDRMPESLLNSGRALSIHIYDLAMNVAGGNPNAYATAVVLVSLLIIINLAASWIAEKWTTLNQLPA